MGGKVRTPEEIAARKAKKETKKAAKRALADAASPQPAKRARSEAADGGGDERPGSAPRSAGRPGSLADRLNPKRECFDAALKARWKSLSKVARQRLFAEDVAARAAAKSAAAPAAAVGPYPFEAHADDHCETSPKAYKDIAVFLELVARRLGKTPETLQIYDPYYCAGSVKKHLAAVGFPCVYNEREDFYARLADDQIPEHDVVVSNPPYSDCSDGGKNHIARLLRFCIKSEKPFLLNMPEYVITSSYYTKYFSKHGEYPLFLCPYSRYHFWTPVGLREVTNKQAHRNPELGIRCSPFVSLWYISLEPATSHDKVMKRVSKGLVQGVDSVSREGGDAPESTGEPSARCRLCRCPEELPESRHTFKGTVRKRAKKAKNDAASSSKKHKDSASAIRS